MNKPQGLHFQGHHNARQSCTSVSSTAGRRCISHLILKAIDLFSPSKIQPRREYQLPVEF
jgi:hypothetical protein